jgi:hypothetical protein
MKSILLTTQALKAFAVAAVLVLVLTACKTTDGRGAPADQTGSDDANAPVPTRNSSIDRNTSWIGGNR